MNNVSIYLRAFKASKTLQYLSWIILALAILTTLIQGFKATTTVFALATIGIALTGLFFRLLAMKHLSIITSSPSIYAEYLLKVYGKKRDVTGYLDLTWDERVDKLLDESGIVIK